MELVQFAWPLVSGSGNMYEQGGNAEVKQMVADGVADVCAYRV